MATPQAEAPAPARRVEEAPADPLHAFRLATKREKLKRRKAEAAAYRPGAGQLKPRHRRQDADKPKLKPKTLDVERFRKAVQEGDVDDAIKQLGSWASQSSCERRENAATARRTLEENATYRRQLREDAALRVKDIVEDAHVLTQLPSVDSFFEKSRAFQEAHATSSCPTKSKSYRGAVPRRLPPKSPVKRAAYPRRCDLPPVDAPAPAPSTNLWWGPAEESSEEEEEREEAVHFWGAASDAESDSSEEAEPWIRDPELLLTPTALLEQQQGSPQDALAAALNAQAASKDRQASECERHARALLGEVRSTRSNYAQSILSRHAARWRLVGARHGVAAAELRRDAAEAARDGVAAPFDRLVARARVVVADEQKKCARHAAPRGNVPWLRRERTESQLARAEAVEEELRERKRGALREHVAFCEDMRDGVRAAEAVLNARHSAHGRAAGRSGMHRFAARLIGRARRRIWRRRKRLHKVAKIQAVQRGVALRARHLASDADSYHSLRSQRTMRSAATAPSYYTAHSETTAPSRAGRSYTASPLTVPSTFGGPYRRPAGPRRAAPDDGYRGAVSYTHLTLPTKRIV